MKLVWLSAGNDSEWLECHKQTCKTRTKCSSGREESCAEQELKLMKEKEKQEQQTGECELARETSQLQERGKNMKQHTCHSVICALTA